VSYFASKKRDGPWRNRAAAPTAWVEDDGDLLRLGSGRGVWADAHAQAAVERPLFDNKMD